MNGLGTQRSYIQAVHWYEKSIEKGNKTSLMQLADCYLKIGKLDSAFQTYKKAADGNDTKAQLIVAQMLRNGKGCEINEEELFLFVDTDGNVFCASKFFYQSCFVFCQIRLDCFQVTFGNVILLVEKRSLGHYLLHFPVGKIQLEGLANVLLKLVGI